MGAPFTTTSVSNYNANPPADDGSQVSANRVQWSTQKTKLADPVYNAFNTSETTTNTAFGKVVGGATITTTAISYTVTASDQSKIVKATAGGITITTPDATVVGAPFVFSVVNLSTSDITFAGNGSQTIDGATSITIPAGCGCMVNTDGSNWFTDGQNFNNVQQQPQGRLTLVTATPVMSSDQTGKTSVFYTPYTGNKVPISTNGTSFRVRSFSQLTLTLLSANHLASTLYDVFLFDNSGVITIGTGPGWSTNTAGSCARGTGAGTTELQLLNGLSTNKNSITARNGSTTYTVAANEGTYVGTIFIDSSAGQVSCHFSYGQSRKFGVWNAYNRVPIVLKAGDSTASWTYAGGSGIRASNNATANSVTVLSGLAEEMYDLRFSQIAQPGASSAGSATTALTFIGWNSTSGGSGKRGQSTITMAGANSLIIENDLVASFIQAPSLGINTVTSLENVAGTTGTFQGTEAFMVLSASWRG